jgi:cyanosortase A-associated protein
MIKNYYILRIILIWLAIVGMLTLLVKSLLLPLSTPLSKTKEFTFLPPKYVNRWRLINSQRLAPQSANANTGYLHQYQNDIAPNTLSIKMYYQTQTDGNVSRLLGLYAGIPPATVNWKIKAHPPQGYYAIFAYQKNIHLTACVFSRGYGTVTEQQFSAYRLGTSQIFPRILPWVLGLESLSESDCWLVLFSLPISKNWSNADLSQRLIEVQKFWLSWLEEIKKARR